MHCLGRLLVKKRKSFRKTAVVHAICALWITKFYGGKFGAFRGQSEDYVTFKFEIGFDQSF